MTGTKVWAAAAALHPPRPAALLVGAGIAFFYLVFNASLLLAFHVRRRDAPGAWKTQPLRAASATPRAPWHALTVAVNLTVAAAAATVTVDAMLSPEVTNVAWGWPVGRGVPAAALRVAGEVCGLLALHQVLEYVWHRAMHAPAVYARWHKIHHYYKAPGPFDDMYVHPVEVFGYYCIMYCPPFLPGVTLHAASLGVYMAVLGTAGVLDHSGVRVRLPWGVYDTAAHDLHHERFNVNYGFPFPLVDMLCGTFAETEERGTTARGEAAGEGAVSARGEGGSGEGARGGVRSSAGGGGLVSAGAAVRRGVGLDSAPPSGGGRAQRRGQVLRSAG